MKEQELIELGFKPSLDKDGKKISQHPEGCMYSLVNGDFVLYTSDMYNYLWVEFKGSSWELLSRNITAERVNKALQFKSRSDIVFLGDD